MCFVWIWEQTAIISLYSINWLVFITETECVYCAVRTGSLYTASLTFSNSTFCPHCVFMCFVWIWEQTAIISLYIINWLDFSNRDELCLLRGTAAFLYIYVKPSVAPCMYACRHNGFITSRYIELKINGGFLTAILSQKRTFSCWSRHIFSRRQQRHLFTILNTMQSIRSAVFLQSFKSSYILSFEVLKEKCFYQARGKQAEVINAALLLHELCWRTLLQGVPFMVSPSIVTLSLTKPVS